MEWGLKDIIRITAFIYVCILSVAAFGVFTALIFIDEENRYTYISLLLAIISLHAPAPMTGIKRPKAKPVLNENVAN